MDLVQKLTTLLPSIVFFLYLITGVAFAYKKDWPWAMVWISYALANVGLVWAQTTK